jgi:hypothetical protein
LWWNRAIESLSPEQPADWMQAAAMMEVCLWKEGMSRMGGWAAGECESIAVEGWKWRRVKVWCKSDAGRQGNRRVG